MMKSLVALMFSLLLMASSTLAQGDAQNTPAEQENVRRAEQLADSFVQRFKETLDFEVVYREFFSVDMAKRSPYISMPWSENRHEEMMKQISPAEAEQAYINFMSLYYLMGLYSANLLTEEEESNDELNYEEVFSPELVATMKEPTICGFFSEYLKAGACQDNTDSFQDGERVRQFIRDANRLAPLFRKYMPPEPFDSPKYKEHLKQLEWDGRETSVNRSDYFDSGEPITMYQVYRGLFVLNIVEENGEMRVGGIPIGN
jgi:hypothetical protein